MLSIRDVIGAIPSMILRVNCTDKNSAHSIDSEIIFVRESKAIRSNRKSVIIPVERIIEVQCALQKISYTLLCGNSN